MLVILMSFLFLQIKAQIVPKVYKGNSSNKSNQINKKFFKQPNAKGDWNYIYPFADRSYVLALQYNIDPADSSSITKNTNIYFGKIGAKTDQVFWRDQVHMQIVKFNIKYEDFNNDGLKDLMLFQTTGSRGSNELYNLYLLNSQHKTLTKILGFDQIPNPSYNEKHKVIVGYGYSGTNNYSIYRIKNNKVYQIGESFVDDENLDLDLKISQILKANRK